jgi:hypothetical protein
MMSIQVTNAEDYTYLLNPETMAEGETLGEHLVVESCLNCDLTEKRKYVTAVRGETGSLEIPVNASANFEISFNVVIFCGGLTFTLYFAEGSSLPIEVRDTHPWCAGYIHVFTEDKSARLDWANSSGIPNFRLVAEGEKLKIGANDEFVMETVLSGTINRIVISEIYGVDRLYEIRAYGIQKVTACPYDPTAHYDRANGRVVIPCITVPVTLPSGDTVIKNYSVEMQQQPNTFTFDLDLNTVVVH